MGIFSTIMNKIFHHDSPTPEPTAPVDEASGAPDAATAAPPPPPAEPVDVEAVLTQLADNKGGGGNWQESIVDLLKLLDMDSSLDARKELADELDIHVGDAGTAEENIALHQAVMQKLAENGGKVPDNLLHH